VPRTWTLARGLREARSYVCRAKQLDRQAIARRPMCVTLDPIFSQDPYRRLRTRHRRAEPQTLTVNADQLQSRIYLRPLAIASATWTRYTGTASGMDAGPTITAPGAAACPKRRAQCVTIRGLLCNRRTTGDDAARLLPRTLVCRVPCGVRGPTHPRPEGAALGCGCSRGHNCQTVRN